MQQKDTEDSYLNLFAERALEKNKNYKQDPGPSARPKRLHLPLPIAGSQHTQATSALNPRSLHRIKALCRAAVETHPNK